MFGRLSCEQRLGLLHCFVNSKLIMELSIRSYVDVYPFGCSFQLQNSASIYIKGFGYVAILNHKLSIPNPLHFVRLKAPEQPAESERCLKLVVVWIPQSSSSLPIFNELIDVLVFPAGKHCRKTQLLLSYEQL